MDGGESEYGYYTKLMTVADGEWAGWQCYPGGDPYEDLTGPFYFRMREDRVRVSAFRAERKHMNAGGNLHGGCAMSFADFALFVIALDAIQDSRTVTATFNCELVGTAREGDLVECTGDVVKSGRSMVFVRGLITCKGEPVMSFSSVIKRVGTRSS
jgi:uncharacterized protein (TIGR00369 family)